MRETNPYPRWRPSHWLWHIRQPSNPQHRMFWALGAERHPGSRIYWCGVFTIFWMEGWGWAIVWNFD